MIKVLVLGSKGMAGHVVAEYLSGLGDYDVYGVARSAGKYVTHELDVSQFNELDCVLQEIKPDYVINCIGILVSKSKGDICTAIQINSYLPNYLASLGLKLGYRLIHISTDCVFSGKEGGYTEKSFRDGDDNYARTKALGEVINDRDLTIRTSIIGPELKENGTGLLDWFLKQNNTIKGFTNAYWSGVTTLELAKAIPEFIEQDIRGLCQLCPKEKISKYELLKLFSQVWNKNIGIVVDSSYCVDKSLISIREDFKYEVPSYPSMLTEAHTWMETHPGYYCHYNGS